MADSVAARVLSARTLDRGIMAGMFVVFLPNVIKKNCEVNSNIPSRDMTISCSNGK